MYDRESSFAQALFRKRYLAMLERIFVATADDERNLAAVGVEDAPEIEAVSLRPVLVDETCGAIQVKESVVSLERGVEIARFLFPRVGILRTVAFRPHDGGDRFERSERTFGEERDAVEALEYGRGEPRVRVPVDEKAAVEDEYTVNFGCADRAFENSG